MSLNPISIATKGYVCVDGPFDIPIATKGYVCIGALIIQRIKARTHDRFNDLRDYVEQARREDEELLVICRGIIELICR